MCSGVQRFQEALQRFNRCLGSEMLHKMKAPITVPQIFMLHFIDEQGESNVTQLAGNLGVKPSAVTVMINRLVKLGYAERSQDTADRRAVRIQATPLGQEVLEQANRDQMEIVGKYLSRLEPHEALAITELLEKMTKHEKGGCS